MAKESSRARGRVPIFARTPEGALRLVAVLALVASTLLCSCAAPGAYYGGYNPYYYGGTSYYGGYYGFGAPYGYAPYGYAPYYGGGPVYRHPAHFYTYGHRGYGYRYAPGTHWGGHGGPSHAGHFGGNGHFGGHGGGRR